MESPNLLAELKRRNVFRVGTAYVVASWLLVQVAETIFPLFGFDETPARITVIVLALGFVPALVFSWIFQLTPEGLRRETEVGTRPAFRQSTARRIDRLIIFLLTLGLAYFSVDKFVLSDYRESALAEAARQEGRSEALDELQGGPSIAVLAFEDLSPDQDQEYFSDGIAEELIHLLAQVPELRVISRTSAFYYKGRNTPLLQIANELGVAHILEGSVRRAGGRLRITVQLIDGRSDAHIWSERFDRELKDIFSIQDDISAAVVARLVPQLTGETPRAQQTNADAYTLELRARHLIRQATVESYAEARALLDEALRIDPRYTPAWLTLATANGNEAVMGVRPAEDAYADALRAATRALQISPDSAFAISAMGTMAMFYQADFAAAARHFQDALAIAPDEPAILFNAATLAGFLNRSELAIALYRHSLLSDPLDPDIHFNMGVFYYWLGHHADAQRSFERVQALTSADSVVTNFYLGLIALQEQRPEDALASMRAEQSRSFRQVGMAVALYALGDAESAQAALDALLDHAGEIGAYQIAMVYAYRNELDRTFEWLDRAAATGDPYLVEIIVEPLFDKARDDPRWGPFLAGIGKSPEELESISFEVPLKSTGGPAGNTPRPP